MPSSLRSFIEARQASLNDELTPLRDQIRALEMRASEIETELRELARAAAAIGHSAGAGGLIRVEEPPISDGEVAARNEDVSVRTGRSKFDFTDRESLERRRHEMLEALSAKIAMPLRRKVSRALYGSTDDSVHVATTISKRYPRGGYNYWYAYHPEWKKYIEASKIGYILLGCMDVTSAFAIPCQEIEKYLPYLNRTETEKGGYWHLHISGGDGDNYRLLLPRSRSEVALSPFELFF